MTKRFHLDWAAMSVLKNCGEVSITANGKYSNPQRRKPDYLIRLSSDGSAWIYCRYDGKLNGYGDYDVDLNWKECRVFLKEKPWILKKIKR